MASAETAVSEKQPMANDKEGQKLEPLDMVLTNRETTLPPWADRDDLAMFFHEKMQPYHDTLEDVHRGLDYAFSSFPGMGGFVIVAGLNDELVGALTMLRTGMKGYVPENLLLFIAVDPALRNHGIGGQLIERMLTECDGAVKLHVEPDNPARRLYERSGFENKYVEMRCVR